MLSNSTNNAFTTQICPKGSSKLNRQPSQYWVNSAWVGEIPQVEAGNDKQLAMKVPCAFFASHLSLPPNHVHCFDFLQSTPRG